MTKTTINVDAICDSIFITARIMRDGTPEYYVHELSMSLQHRESWGPFETAAKAAVQRRSLRNHLKQWDKASNASKTYYQERLTQTRQQRLRQITKRAPLHMADWRDGHFFGPRYYALVRNSSTVFGPVLYLRDVDLADPGITPVAVWVGTMAHNYRPMLIHYNDEYRLWPFIGQYAHTPLHVLHEVRIFLNFTLLIDKAMLE